MIRQVFLIARRDFLQRARSKAFLASMLVIVGLVLVMGPLLSLQNRAPSPYDIGVVGAEPDGLDASLHSAVRLFDRRAVVHRYQSLAAAEEALDGGSVDVLLVDDQEVVWREEADPQLEAVVAAAFGDIDRRRVMAELGLTEEEASRLLSPAQQRDSSTLQEPDPDADAKKIAAYAGNVVLYISILMFGQFVLMGVMEEKSSRVVEVVLSRAQPRHLLAGKVLGIGALGLIQLVVLIVAALVTLSMADIADVDVAALGFRTAGIVLLWFFLGFAFFSVLYAGLGATISRQEDLQGVAMIPVLFLLPGYFISFIALDDPEALIARIASIVPPLSPLVMPIRTIAGSVPPEQVALAVALILLATYGIIRFAGRVYRGSILRIGAKVRLREAWRASRG